MNIFLKMRKELSLTQKEVAEKLNVKQNTVSRWENGETMPDYPTLIAFADFFEVSVDYLLGRTDDFDNIIVPKVVETPVSFEEQEFLSKFRRLNKIDKNSIVLMLDAFIERAESGNAGSSGKKAN